MRPGKAPHTSSKALRRLKRKGELKDTVRHRTSKYLNNGIEADHGALKRLIRPTRGVQSMKTAYATIQGFEVMRMIRRRHCILLIKASASLILDSVLFFSCMHRRWVMGNLYHSLSKAAVWLAFLGAAILAMPAVAQTFNGTVGGVTPQISRAFLTAQSTARLAALIAQSGAVVRSKNVANVTKPSVGITCIQPTPGRGIDIGRIIPSVSVEWGWSSGNDLVAYYFSRDPGFFTDCPAGYIEVRTYDFAGHLSNRVAFTIVVD